MDVGVGSVEEDGVNHSTRMASSKITGDQYVPDASACFFASNAETLKTSLFVAEEKRSSVSYPILLISMPNRTDAASGDVIMKFETFPPATLLHRMSNLESADSEAIYRWTPIFTLLATSWRPFWLRRFSRRCAPILVRRI